MEHSLEKYLQRQPTQTLEALLQECAQNVLSYGYILPEVRALLAAREQKPPVTQNNPGR